MKRLLPLLLCMVNFLNASTIYKEKKPLARATFLRFNNFAGRVITDITIEFNHPHSLNKIGRTIDEHGHRTEWAQNSYRMPVATEQYMQERALLDSLYTDCKKIDTVIPYLYVRDHQIERVYYIYEDGTLRMLFEKPPKS